jgi:hypothetical protein
MVGVVASLERGVASLEAVVVAVSVDLAVAHPAAVAHPVVGNLVQ